ncbi:MAG: polysaccharide deacetylase family protein [Eubacterium sp.]|jgi:peptidoglycan/xylan/chitin deacetylase (PgdA/CDA1 family)|nr:polysaccharide deacetylase family protein [Eubacterium sp.]
MNRRIKARRKISRNFNQRKGKKQNVILAVSVSAAVVMILLLSIVKIYSTVKNNRSGDGPNARQVQATASPVPESVEAAAQPTPTPAPVIRDKAVALTFDDGPSRANDGRIVETLQKYGAHATFFVLGDRARVDGDILQMYLAAGCEIGSHSWNHPQLSKMKWDEIERQLSKTNKTVSKLTGGYQIQLLRPPYGSISNTMRKKLDMPMILWSLDTLDWKTRNTKKIFREVRKEVKDGDIILMHDIYSTTADAVEKVVPWLQNKGYDILTVSELMERKGKNIEGGSAYLNGR